MPESRIRPVSPADADAIAALTMAAFGRPDEAGLVAALTDDGDATISLVAEHDGEVIGHILLSPMRASFRALGLAPISVVPSAQRQGVGGALIRAAIDRARADGWRAIFLLGEQDYYGRFGFSAAAARPFGSSYAGPYFQMLALDDAPLDADDVEYAPAFNRL